MPHFFFMPRLLSHLFAILLALVLSGGDARAAKVARTGADLFPSTTVIYAELGQSADVIRFVMDSPLRKNLEATEIYPYLVGNEEYQGFLTILGAIETQAGMKWRSTLEAITAGGVYLGVDSETEGLAVLLKADDAGTLDKAVQTLIGLTRDDAKSKGNPDPLPSQLHREVEVYKAGEGGFAVVDQWLIFVNKGDLGKAILDNLLDANEQTLSANKDFRTARKSAAKGKSLWAYTDLNAIRSAGIAEALFTGKTENPGAELLFGGIAEALKDTPYVTGTLDFADEGAVLTLSVPMDSAAASESRSFFFGPKGKGAAEKPILPRGTLLSISTYRDLSAMWLAADDLFNENQAAKLAQSETTLGLFFNGKDFGKEVLGQLAPQVQLVVARQDFKAAGGPIPAVKYPAGALVFHTKEPETMQRYLRLAFQTVVGFINIQGTQQGRSPFELNNSKQGDATVISADYFLSDEEKKETDAAVHHNFSPAIAQVGDYFVLSSARQLASSLIEALAKRPKPESLDVNTRFHLDAKELAVILDDNKGQLIASNQLKKGQTEDEAAGEITVLLTLVDMFRDASLELKTGNGQLGLNFSIGVAAATSK
jgi:hypothetical protein